MKEIFILLGSNRGNREEYLAMALEMIASEDVRVVRYSSVYESPPWGFDDQVSFLNQAAELETALTAEQLMPYLHAIEARLGRVRPSGGCGCTVSFTGLTDTPQSAKKANGYDGRTMDIDILFYGNRLVFTEDLMIPHPRLHERRFTLMPMEELAPQFQHPVLKRSISELIALCSDTSRVIKLKI